MNDSKIEMSISKIEMREGYTKIAGYLSDQELHELSKISDRIVKIGLGLRKFGLGNRSYRNCTVFSGDLILKHPLFVDVLEKLVPIAQSQLGESFQLSEFKLVSSTKADNFKMWWHRDFPFLENVDKRLDDKIALAVIVPLCDFNSMVGSTYVLPNSHLKRKFPEEYRAPDFYGDGLQLESKLGDVWVYDPRLIHSGAPNHSTKFRHIILAQFVLPVFSAREDFKFQVERMPFKSPFLRSKKILWNTHKPDRNTFGSNRGWSHTIFRPIVRIAGILNRSFGKFLNYIKYKVFLAF
jgi:hypothetical protein